MSYDFDRVIDRKNTDSIKYDFAAERGKPAGLLPLWVADMDFSAPPAVIEALEEKSRHGVFGYSESKEDYFDVLQRWFLRRFQWQVEPSWLVKTPGVVFALCAAIRGLTEEGDAVLIQQPVYYPFAEAILENRRKPVVNELFYHNGAYTMDLADFEKKVAEQRVKIFILCNPHNPVGRVWSEEELTAVGNLCLRYGVTVISDEIHADFIYPGYRHRVFADICPAFADIAITCTAPTKTFNLAGLQISHIFIANREIRQKVMGEIHRTGYSQPNVMGLVAARAAYRHGEAWLEALQAYLAGNLDMARHFLAGRLPKIRLVEPGGTYLLWLDCRSLGLSDPALDDLILHKAGLWLDAGAMFGLGGAGFQRVNIACPREILRKALNQLAGALSDF